MADRYRKVRRVLRKIKAHIKHVEQTAHNRASRRRALYEGDVMKKLVAKLKEEKRNVSTMQ